MIMTHGNTTDCHTTDCHSIEQLLLALDAEADTLSPYIAGKLALTRHRIIANAQRQGMKGISPACHLEQAARHIRNFCQTLHCNRPVTTALASISIASLTTLMLLGGIDMQNSPEEIIEMTSLDSLEAADQVVSASNPASLPAAAFGNELTDHLPVISSEESLDLVGSVDFLLWLDSQQG